MFMPPPVEVIVADEPAPGAVIVSGLAPPPESMLMLDAPETWARAPKVSDGVPMRIGPPPMIERL